MKRKIKITGKVVKKTILWTLLVALVVGATILIVNSFNRDNVLSNNTVLNDVDYTGEYRSYLEKELLIKEKGGNYDDIISDAINTERENKEKEGQAKLDEAKKIYDEDIQVLEESTNGKIANAKKQAEEDIADIEASDDTEETKKSKIALVKGNLENKIEELNKALDIDKADRKSKYDKEVQDLEADIKDSIESVNEAYVLEILIKDILKGRNLTDVIKDPENTPTGFVYNKDESKNSAIKAEFDDDKTEAANTVDSSKIDTQSGLSFVFNDVNYIYSGKNGSVVYTVNVTKSGYYNILLDYVPYSSTEAMNASNTAITEVSGGAAIERKIKVDDELLFNDLGNVSFLRSWSDGGKKFIDATGNEIKPKQVEKPQDLQQYVKDSVGYVNEPYLVYFSKGTHTIEFESIRENMGIANVYLTSKENYINYSEYQINHANDKKIEGKISYNIQGEGGQSQYMEDGKPAEKIFPTSVTRSSSTIYGTSDRTSPNNQVIQDEKRLKASPVKIVLNTIGGAKWSTPGDWISWTVNIKESGLYKISLRAKQNVSRGLFSSRKLSIDGSVPFKEAMNCKFVYRSDWSIVTLGGQDAEGNDQEYYFYLEAGEHTLTLECTLGDYASQIARVQGVIDELNILYRKIIQKTGINPDPYMDYFKNLSGKKLIKEAMEIFQNSIDTLHDVSQTITAISGEKSSETASLDTMGIQLKQFIKDYRKIQKNLQDFSTNISSLGTWILDVSQQALSIDYIMVHSDDYRLPRANPNFFAGFWFDIRGFFGSFFFDYESVGLTEANEDWETIEVWLCTSLNQGREQANAISAMISEACETPSSILYGINVKLKVVSPDVLLTATLAGRGPDVAINVANGTPVNYALRGATYDLTKFTKDSIKEHFQGSKVNYENITSFQEMTQAEKMELDGGTRRFHPSAMVPYEYEGGYYALPYTQSFLMMFYRKDMFAEYEWDIPKTWGDVIQLIPELQIMNFQFYLPLNTSGAASVVNQIFASYLYQTVDDASQAFYRKSINEFGEEFIESNFDSEEAQKAFEFWCSFYTDYSFPLAASFVNRFRSGETPIGIVGYDTYNTLTVSAPEIRGKWDFALLPGTEKVDSEGNKYIDNLGAASGTAIIMMNTTDHPFESWAFMDWFTSADIQVSFAREIEAILGAAARHNTANVAAFSRLAWTEDEKKVLMEQWKHTIGVPEVAGGYYTGRNLENAFREVVNKNLNPRQVLSDYIITINNEIDRKREEFGLASSTKKAKENR